MSQPVAYQVRDHLTSTQTIMSQPVVYLVKGPRGCGVPRPLCHSQLFTRSRTIVTVVYPNHHVTATLTVQGPSAVGVPIPSCQSQNFVYQVRGHSDRGCVSKASCHSQFFTGSRATVTGVSKLSCHCQLRIGSRATVTGVSKLSCHSQLRIRSRATVTGV